MFHVISIHALREEGDELQVFPPEVAVGISIHALREEGDPNGLLIMLDDLDFNPRPPRGGRPRSPSFIVVSRLFQSTPSARRATREIAALKAIKDISIHALREEGDIRLLLRLLPSSDFNPRPPRGGRHYGRQSQCSTSLFQSTPSARRATAAYKAADAAEKISIHALREEGDRTQNATVFLLIQFQSTPSARRATSRNWSTTSSRKNFNPRPPRGGRPAGAVLPRAFQAISIHALREEGDSFCASAI